MPEMRFPILLQRDDAGYLSYHPNTIGTMARVSKATARKLYDAGVEVVIVAHKFLPYPDAPNGVAMRMNKARDITNMGAFDTPAELFDKLAQSYAWYNCNWETGYYPAFWVKYETYHVYAERWGHRLYQGVVQAPDTAPKAD